MTYLEDLWSEDFKYRLWLEIELTVYETMIQAGLIPVSDETCSVRERASYNRQHIKELEEVLHHDVIAFLTCIQESLGPAGRYLHMGMTSSDLVDTALCYQMKESALYLLSLTDQLYYVQHLLNYAVEVISVGKISGPVGTYSSVGPEIEKRVLKKFGLQVPKVTNQIIQRDRHADYLCQLALAGNHLVRYSRKNRDLLPLLHRAALAGLENVALWHERDISHSSVERIIIPEAILTLERMILNVN